MSSLTDPCLIPAGSAPEGKHSNFDNPPSLAPAMMVVMSFMILWGTAFTVARFYINFRKLKLSDYFASVALLISIAILGIQATQVRTARHIWDVPVCFFDSDYAKSVYFPAILLQIGAFLAKASIFLLFQQIFTVLKPMRYAIWVGLAATFLLYCPGVVVATYYETPRPGQTWVDVLEDGSSLIPLRWWQAQSALGIVLDIYIFVLPLPAISKLNMPTRQRLSIIAVFSLALMGIGASVASLVERVKITHTKDTTWISTILALCSFVELTVAIIVCSAPGFTNFSRSYFPKLSSVLSRSKPSDSEDILIESRDKYRSSSRTKSTGVAGELPLDHNRPYYELDDAWKHQRGATVNQGNEYVHASLPKAHAPDSLYSSPSL